jgi:hypothetical protein
MRRVLGAVGFCCLAWRKVVHNNGRTPDAVVEGPNPGAADVAAHPMTPDPERRDLHVPARRRIFPGLDHQHPSFFSRRLLSLRSEASARACRGDGVEQRLPVHRAMINTGSDDERRSAPEAEGVSLIHVARKNSIDAIHVFLERLP